MKKNIFELTQEQLHDTVVSFQEKFEKGLRADNTEIQCLPTYITPNTTISDGRALVLDLGGTNYRAAVIEFKDGEPQVHPSDSWKKKLDVMKTEGFTREDLFKEQADLIDEMNPNQTMPIGYCFSYPAESMLNGDAKLIRWTKGVNIKEMVGQPVGGPLRDYLNARKVADFTTIKVINDTVASLFAGLTNPKYDAYIGLIVGTGTNMATFIPREHIKKIDHHYKGTGLIPVNLESGNFTPPHLTNIDNLVDELSNSHNKQRFEKAVSGMYLGEVFKAVFPNECQEEGFNAKDLNHIVNNSKLYKKEFVDVANWIFDRSAKLVAASLAGLILVLRKYNHSMKHVCLTAEGTVFWSKLGPDTTYQQKVMEELYRLLEEFGHKDIKVDVEEKKNINLIGTAMAALAK